VSAEVELHKIRQNLDVLTNLYVKLVERLLPEEDITAIKDEDETAGRKSYCGPFKIPFTYLCMPCFCV
jgi:hypothetical protein